MLFDSKQADDSWLTFVEGDRWLVRYLYSRSAESRASGSEGQDYLIWNHLGDSLIFVVCDGVGSSFCGNIAAGFLAKKLIELLDDSGPKMDKMSESDLKEHALKYLNRWQAEGNDLVEQEVIQAPPGSLMEKALEQQRREQGSETVFVCGRLSLEAPSRRLSLIWMGDCEAHLFDESGESVPVAPDEDRVASDRWSTKCGTRSKKGSGLHTKIFDIDEQRIQRIVAHSDGLSSLVDGVDRLGDDAMHRAVLSLLRSPKSDDISFIDVSLKPSVSEGTLEVPGEPVIVTDGKERLDWCEVPGAKEYEVEVSDSVLFLHPEGQLVASPQLELELTRGSCYYRVRVVEEGKVGGWSPVVPGPSRPSPEVECTEEDGEFMVGWQPQVDDWLCVITEISQGRPNRVFLEPAKSEIWMAPEVEAGRYHYQVEISDKQGQVSEPSELFLRTIPECPDSERGDEEASELGLPQEEDEPVENAATSDSARDPESLDRDDGPREVGASGENAVVEADKGQLSLSRDSSSSELPASTFSPASESLTKDQASNILESGLGSSARFDHERRSKTPIGIAEDSQGGGVRVGGKGPEVGWSKGPRPLPIENPQRSDRYVVTAHSADGQGALSLWEAEKKDSFSARRVWGKPVIRNREYRWVVEKAQKGTYYYWVAVGSARPEKSAHCEKTEVKRFAPHLNFEPIDIWSSDRQKLPAENCRFRLKWHWRSTKKRSYLLEIRPELGDKSEMIENGWHRELDLPPGRYDIELKARSGKPRPMRSIIHVTIKKRESAEGFDCDWVIRW